MKKFTVIFALLIVGLTAQFGFAQQDDKEKNKELLIKATRILENDPFVDKAKDFRAWAVNYVIETDDVSILVCTGVLDGVMEKKNKYSSELLAQYTMGMAAFKLENPSQANDENAAQLAGLESMLKSYEAMIKQKPKAKFAAVDTLLEKRNTGELKKLVEEKNCKGSETEEIKQ